MNKEPPRSDALVVFGVTGDLAYRKIFPALQALTRRGRLDMPVVGVARGGLGLEGLRARARDGLERHGGGFDPQAGPALLARLRYVDGDYRDPATFVALRAALEGARHVLHYLALPPSLFGTVIAQLAAVGCTDGARVVVEKPLGRDLDSARRLNAVLREHFGEEDVFRIDHFLGKESVQNLLYFRFANRFLEPIWSREHVASVQLTMAEAIGIEGRGALYEELGVVRDVVQNHLLEIVSLLAMEPPGGGIDTDLRDQKSLVLRALRAEPAPAADGAARRPALVLGQYQGYRDEPGVAPDSRVATYAALRFGIDTWRWAGVPFLIRTGKCLPLNRTEVLVTLRDPPLQLFEERVALPANHLRINLGPERIAIALGVRVKAAGERFAGRPVELSVCNAEPDEMMAYERLLADALRGDARLFARADAIEAQWAFVDTLLAQAAPPEPYLPRSWGPLGAQDVAAAQGGWHDPAPGADSGCD